VEGSFAEALLYAAPDRCCRWEACAVPLFEATLALDELGVTWSTSAPGKLFASLRCAAAACARLENRPE
jgi:hypothetical protein